MFKNMCVEKTIETALLLCYGVNEKSAQCFFYSEIERNAISLCSLKIAFCDALCKMSETSEGFCLPMASCIAAL